MSDRNPAHPAPAPTDAGLPAAPQPDGAALDAHGFDPAEFEWRPVPRRPRKDGWTPEAQQRFIEALARTGVVDQACEEVGLSVRSAYNLRNAPGGERFAKAWRDVLARAADRLLDVAFEQAILGEEVPIFDQDGRRTGATRRYNTRMAMFLLRAYQPERFRHAHKDVRGPDEAPAPPPVPTPQTVAALAPVTPAAPHRLMPPHGAALIADAREATAPLDLTEAWRPVRVPDAPAHVGDRARRRQMARLRAEDRRDARLEREGYILPPASDCGDYA